MAKSKAVVLRTPEDHKREFTKIFRSVSSKHTPWQVFSDFLEMAALAYSNRCDARQYAEREERYLKLINSYDRDEDRRRFPELLALAALSYQKRGPHDFFGELFGPMGLDLGNKRLGQIFTPYPISLMMAEMTLNDCKTMVEERGFFTMLEPASGAGGMIAAAAEAVLRQDLNPSEVMHVTAVDIDPRCAWMSYLTCCMLDLPAVIQCGDSLRMEMHSTWFTPRHVFGGWNKKLADADHKETLTAMPLWKALEAPAEAAE